MAEWSVDLAASFAAQDSDLLLAAADTHGNGSPEPESSASELEDFELGCLHEMFQADPLLVQPGDDAVLLSPGGKRVVQPASAPLEESFLHTLTTDMDDSAASTHTTCSPDGSDAFELREDSMLDLLVGEKPTISTEPCPPGPAGPNNTPPAQENAGHKRKAEIEFPPVGAPRTAGLTSAGAAVVPLASSSAAASAGAAQQSSVVLPTPETAAQHRFTNAELEKLDLETTRANDIVAALMARDPSTLSPEEVKLLKKHKRLIKNRESAQLSRQRKKNHLETLEMQVQQLEKERASLTARMERLVEENAFLKKQLLAQGRMPAVQQPGAPGATGAAAPAATTAAAPASGKGAPVTPALPTAQAAQVAPGHPVFVPPVKSAAPASTAGKAPRGSVLLAVCLFAGMFFTSVDLFQERLPQIYTAPDAVDLPRGYEAAGAMSGRRAGRVLLATSSADEPPLWGEDKGSGRSRDLERRDLLVVTLLDHLVSQLGTHASPSLFGRVCRKLVDMKVLKGCEFLSEDGGLDAVRAQYVAEFAELNDVFVKDSEEVRMDAEFTFANKRQPGNALAKGITSAPPHPPTMPLPGRNLPNGEMKQVPLTSSLESWETLGLDELLKRRDEERQEGSTDGETGKEWRMLCPGAQMLLIADKPANQDMSVAARLSRKQRLAKLGAENLLNNGTRTEDRASMEMGQGQPPLSMILPRRAISDPRFVKMLPEEQSPLVEVQCKKFELIPLTPTSSAVTTV